MLTVLLALLGALVGTILGAVLLRSLCSHFGVARPSFSKALMINVVTGIVCAVTNWFASQTLRNVDFGFGATRQENLIFANLLIDAFIVVILYWALLRTTIGKAVKIWSVQLLFGFAIFCAIYFLFMRDGLH